MFVSYYELNSRWMDWDLILTLNFSSCLLQFRREHLILKKQRLILKVQLISDFLSVGKLSTSIPSI